MGPLRFELRSEDPQSPRMARLPYGPALLLLAHFIYLSSCDKVELIAFGENLSYTGTAAYEKFICSVRLFTVNSPL
jgi:hypothetical protein